MPNVALGMAFQRALELKWALWLESGESEDARVNVGFAMGMWISMGIKSSTSMINGIVCRVENNACCSEVLKHVRNCKFETCQCISIHGQLACFRKRVLCVAA